MLLTNVCQVAEAVRNRQYDAVFSLSGVVVDTRESSGIDLSFLLKDDTGSLFFYDCVDEPHPHVPPAGTIVRISGDMARGEAIRSPLPAARSIDALKNGPAPTPVPAEAAKVESGCYDNQLISLSGTIRDAYADESDRHAHFIQLDCHGEIILLVAYSRTDQTAVLRKYIGRELTICGPCCRQNSSQRLIWNRYVRLHDIGDIERTAASRDPFAAPAGSCTFDMSPNELCNFGCCRISGIVVATWQGRHVLLKSNGRLSRVTLAEPAAPAVGSAVDVAGFATTDLYSLNLFNAVWRPSADATSPTQTRRLDAPTILSPDDLFGRAPDGRSIINARANGEAFRFNGTVKALSQDGTFALDVDNTLLNIDASSSSHALQELRLDDKVEVSGVCITDRDEWSPLQPFPRTRGILLVVRDNADIRLVAHPSWWTRGRLLFLLAILAGIVCIVSTWNFFLNRLAERRGQLLYSERIARESANLRASERTRLATELHDSMAQNLAAIACELTSARRLGAHDSAAAVEKLPVLERMMQSCQTELRQCLFDLRSNLLDERDLATAIRRSLRQICDASCIAMRLHLSRSQIQDTTMHAVVLIVRELVSNALRHGNATNIKICGVIDGQTLRFAVSDNGCGFDEANHPGPETGHFGLAGIENRLQNLKGSLRISSHSGKGTRTEFSIPLNDEDKNGKD